jgi:ribokinase
MSIVSIGVYSRDLYMFCPRLPGPGESVCSTEYAESHGGKAANQAIAAARLGARTTLITRLGLDRFGKDAYKLLVNEGVNVNSIIFDQVGSTGVGFIVLDPSGVQLITTYSGVSGHLEIIDIEKNASILDAASTLLLQGEISPEISLSAARIAGEKSIVILDPSPIEGFSGIKRFDNVDILTPNEQEAAKLAGIENPSALIIAEITGIPTVIITRGAKGAEVYTGGVTYHLPAFPVKVIDTTGAGDAFNGALAAAIDRGMNLLSASEHACKCASFCVGRRFCIPSFATINDVPWDSE